MKLRFVNVQDNCRRPWLGFALGLVLLAGCAQPRPVDPGSIVDLIAAPEIPAFLGGPMAVLLTNTDGFQSQVVLELRTESNHVELASGDLIGRGSRLLFIPEHAEEESRFFYSREMSFLWDVDQNKGYVLSDALQGFALMSSPAQFTNVLVQAWKSQSTLEKVEGYSCEQEDDIVSAADGSTTVLHSWNATKLNRFPLRIRSTNGTTSLTLKISDVELVKPPLEALILPEGFTKYDTVDDMMTELLKRHQDMRRRPPGRWSHRYRSRIRY
jgi:hypothetical protein